MFTNDLPVDLGAVGTVKIFDERILQDGNDGRMFSADGAHVEDDIIVRATAKRHPFFMECQALHNTATD